MCDLGDDGEHAAGHETLRDLYIGAVRLGVDPVKLFESFDVSER
ncbi:hypothetical protein IFM12275_40570 [Nocardia sputorum]|nr:hypothetical protein IFM12275_40570 [Nocardia sputorum]